MVYEMSKTKDTGVDRISDCLNDKKIALVISGGIAATESIKISREIRRHGGSVYPIMTKSAEKIISPLAVSWGAGRVSLTKEWNHKMAQLDSFDAVLLAPATRNTIAKFVHGIIDSPALMSLSAASGKEIPTLFVPSMHNDLFDDPVTDELLKSASKKGVEIFLSDSVEDRRKQPDPVSIVAKLCHIMNSKLPLRNRIAITLGATKSPIDSVRFIQNSSSGRTGWSIAEHLFRMGHDVICVVGETHYEPSFVLPDIRKSSTPDKMLEICIDLASSSNPPRFWIHSAAVLDYQPEKEPGKRKSGDDKWNLSLYPSAKHLGALTEYTSGSTRIGFKLEDDSNSENLIPRASDLISKYGLHAVVANLISEASEKSLLRCRIVFPNNEVTEITTLEELCNNLESMISEN
ncbi:MAG: hypothetical protein CMA12_02845 [Euryarchaeota archaeon]|nr:hypothetical protein [Euryarchaeota archaeon]OUW22630.1 MAG: hypothetical protein CBD33_01415 [Euryarchaeota archaeon TMED173]